MMHDVFESRLARNDAAIGTLALGRIPFEKLAASDNFKTRLRQRLAVLHVMSWAISSMRSRMSRAALRITSALRRRNPAPHAETLCGGVERLVEIGARSDRHRADNGFIGGVEHRQRVGSLAPGAANIQHEVGIVLGHDSLHHLPAANAPEGRPGFRQAAKG